MVTPTMPRSTSRLRPALVPPSVPASGLLGPAVPASLAAQALVQDGMEVEEVAVDEDAEAGMVTPALDTDAGVDPLSAVADCDVLEAAALDVAGVDALGVLEVDALGVLEVDALGLVVEVDVLAGVVIPEALAPAAAPA